MMEPLIKKERNLDELKVEGYLKRDVIDIVDTIKEDIAGRINEEASDEYHTGLLDALGIINKRIFGGEEELSDRQERIGDIDE